MGVFDSEARKVTGSFIDSWSSTANNTTFSFSNMVPARAVTTRYVLVLLWDGNNNRALMSGSIAGAATTTREIDSIANQRVYIVDAEVPAGAAADVDVTLSGNLGLGGVFLAALFDVGSGVYRAGDSDAANDNSSSSNLAVINGEYVIGGAMAFRAAGGAGNYAWAGLTELVDVDLRDSRLTAAAHAVTADGTLSIVAGVPTADRNVFAVAAYEPG